MYSFSAQKNETELFGSGQIENLALFFEYNEVQIQGRMRALFGEPLYETGNYEDAYVKIKQGIQNGVPFYEETEIEEDA